MIKIAIDINDVIRAYTAKFSEQYKKNIDREINLEEIEFWTNDLRQIFNFERKEDYLSFLYDDYVFEIFGSANPTNKNLPSRFSDWLKELEDFDEKFEITLISIGEYDKSIGSTYFFLSKIACKVPNVKLYLHQPEDLWENYDVIITANPEILTTKSEEDTISIKINQEYNQEYSSTYDYDEFFSFLIDEEIMDKIITTYDKN